MADFWREVFTQAGRRIKILFVPFLGLYVLLGVVAATVLQLELPEVVGYVVAGVLGLLFAHWSLKKEEMTPEGREVQRRSFVYGNCHINNPDVTRKLVDEVADEQARRTGDR